MKNWVAIVALLGMVCAATATATPIGLTVSDQGDGPDIYYRVDLTTGVATVIADLGDLTDAEAEGLALNPLTGEVFGVSEPNPTDGTGVFYDLTPGSSTLGDVVGTIDARIGTEAGAEIDPTTGLVYSITGDETVPNSQLYLHDFPGSGVTEIGDVNDIFLDNLAINADGEAFAADLRTTDSLYGVDLTTGELTLIGAFGPDLDLDAGAAFSADGTLYVLGEDGRIWTVDTTTGAFLSVINITDASGNLLAGDFEGLAIIPEPASIALLGLGAVGAIGLIHRRRA